MHENALTMTSASPVRSWCAWAMTSLVLIGTFAATAATLSAATLRTGFSETIVVDGLVEPTAMAVAIDGRIFVAQQGGAVRVVRDGVLLAAPFVTLAVNASGERGLIGIALDPQLD